MLPVCRCFGTSAWDQLCCSGDVLLGIATSFTCAATGGTCVRRRTYAFSCGGTTSPGHDEHATSVERCGKRVRCRSGRHDCFPAGNRPLRVGGPPALVAPSGQARCRPPLGEKARGRLLLGPRAREAGHLVLLSKASVRYSLAASATLARQGWGWGWKSAPALNSLEQRLPVNLLGH